MSPKRFAKSPKKQVLTDYLMISSRHFKILTFSTAGAFAVVTVEGVSHLVSSKNKKVIKITDSYSGQIMSELQF